MAKILNLELMIFFKLQISFFLLVSKPCFTQTIKQLEKFSTKHQICLDSGVRMLACSKKYYTIMDSMLNVIYNKLKLSNINNNRLKNNQLRWLAKRDSYFKTQDSLFIENTKTENWGQDMEMITIDKKAEFVKNRVIYLINYKHK